MGLFFSIGLLVGGFFVLYIFLFVAAFSQDLARLIDASVVAVFKDVVGPISAGFGGAIAGAYSAYLLQQKNEEHKERKLEHSIVHGAIIQLSEMLRSLLIVKRYSLHPYLNDDVRFLVIPKTPLGGAALGSVDDRVINVLVSIKASSAMNAVLLAVSGYRVCYENFAGRNQSLDEYSAVLQKSKFAFEDKLSLRDIASVVGGGRLLSIYENTELMLGHLDESLNNLRKSLELISETFDAKFKEEGASIMRINFSENAEYFEKVPDPKFTKETLGEYLKHFRTTEPPSEGARSWS